MTVEVQATLTRIKTHPGVLGTLIIDPDGTVLDHELQDKIKDNQQDLAAFIPALGAMASDLVRDLDPQNDLQFLRIRSQKYEILVAPSVYLFCMQPSCSLCLHRHASLLQDPGLCW